MQIIEFFLQAFVDNLDTEKEIRSVSTLTASELFPLKITTVCEMHIFQGIQNLGYQKKNICLILSSKIIFDLFQKNNSYNRLIGIIGL